MKLLLLIAATTIVTTAAQAAPWRSEQFLLEQDNPYYYAYQGDESDGEHRLAYGCEYATGIDSLFIETPDLFDPTTSYAPEVPTSFTIDGEETIEINGQFQDRGGYLSVVYNSFVLDGFGTLLDTLIVAQSSIRVTFFDRDLSFSPQGLREAVKPIYDECVF